jgi:hypothetical protein
MKQGIVVCTWSGGKDWTWLCLNSLEPIYGKYPIYVVINDYKNAPKDWIEELNKYVNVILIESDLREIGALTSIVKNTDLDEFWFFQDTIEITDTTFIVRSFEDFPGNSMSYMQNYMQYYLGKWKSEVIRSMDIKLPEKISKLEAIEYELKFANSYAAKDFSKSPLAIDASMGYSNYRSNYIDTLLGDERLAVVGKYLIKRLSIVKENMRYSRDTYLSEKEVLEFKNSYRRMIYAPVA